MTLTGSATMGRFYWGVRLVRAKKNRLVCVYANEIKIENGDLLLIGKDGLYRAFSRGTWQEVFAASCMDGSECGEDHDIEVSTGKDARLPVS